MSESARPNHAEDLTRFSLNRRITVLVLFMSILVVGSVATIGIPVELFPRGWTSQSLSVDVPWVDAPTREVLDKLILPLEEELSTVKGVDSVRSYARKGYASVNLIFKQGVDMDVAYRETRDRVERARALFPDGADRVFISKEDSSGVPVAAIGMTVDPDLVDTYNLIQDLVVKRLQRIEGVATISSDGLEEKEIIIELDRDAAESAGLNIYELSQQLGSDNFTMASGQVMDSGKKFLLRSVATYADLDALENRQITSSVRLKDIATIRYEEAEKRYAVRVNSKPAVALIIMKEGEANTVEVSQKINETIAEMADDPKLAGLDLENLFNQGDIIKESLGNLYSGGRIGAMFAIIVLFFFLRRFRLTLIITLSIPLSILIALTVMYFMGETLNILSILGLMVCVGLLVDNSVVVAENIHRLHRAGMNKYDACVKGAGEIALAIVMATLTTVTVFLPVSLVKGQGQFFLLRLAVPISVSLIASLFIALIFIPLCVYLTLPKTHDAAKSGGLLGSHHQKLNDVLRWMYDNTFEKLNHIYTKWLAVFLNYRIDLILLLLAVYAGTLIFSQGRLDIKPNQEEDRSSANIYVDAGVENSFDDIKEYFLDIEKVLETKRETLGLDGFLLVTFPQGGRVQVWLRDEDPPYPAATVGDMLLESLPERPGYKFYLGRQNNTDTKAKDTVYTVMLEGEDPETLEQVGERLEPTFLAMEGVAGLQQGQEAAPGELALVIDRDKANAAGVDPQTIAGVIGYALRGSPLPKYNDDGKMIPVRIRFREADREGLSELNSFLAPTRNGGSAVQIASVTDKKMLQSLKGISRQNKKMSYSLAFQLKEENVDETRERLDALTARLDLPEGVGFYKGSGSTENEDLKSLQFALLASIVFIYLLMGFLFESFILPLSIILTIPLAVIGVIWAHLLTGKDMDFLGVVGGVLLVGVVVNNGIVLLDYVNRLRKEGKNRTEALLLSAERRFRPIVMTALTTIIGMIPLTTSKATSMGLSYKSFGLTLIGGMSTATILTLLVIPVFYSLLDDLRIMCGAGLKRVSLYRGKYSLTNRFRERIQEP